MTHQIFSTNIDISETDITFKSVYQKAWFPTELKNEIKKANFLILPTDYSTNNNEVLFPEMTGDFLQYVKKHSETPLIADIAISDDGFRRVEKHSALIEVATIIITDVVLPIAISLISSYLYDAVKKLRRKPNETSTRVNIIVEENGKKTTTKIEYEGPIEGMKETLDKVASNIRKKNND